ncbi:MAG: tRNA pseudouridine(38-40) synthase TruA [Armatimonadota bacterium]|nr:tRNA pseudouridine(38-40) synthase TruA [bacterium]MDW8103530.1 tRNA pseudouridine(38-40) synthase TruA [Armatimonadota bacterium]MDW8289488.1 tRNA pseudouridine(38-40) synthase TruA [Armatimonadota bacterium]
MRTIAVVIEYDGTDFAGFQIQRGQRTVQAELCRAVQKITGEAVPVIGASRTDAGAHATGQVVHFRTTCRIPIERVPAALNSVLPRDVAARWAWEADERFHARYSARSRVYRYTVWNHPVRSALMERYAYRVTLPLDVAAMREAAQYLVGRHDYAAFASEVGRYRHTVREVYRAELGARPPLVWLRIEANGFLQGMVRAIMGTLIEVGLGKRTPETLVQLLDGGRRGEAGFSVPAHGLCLVRVNYERSTILRSKQG